MSEFKNNIIAKIRKILTDGSAGTKLPDIGLALSGGIDSMVLLDILLSVELKPFYKRLFAFHFNHGLRGEAADGDELFLQQYCKELDVSYFSDRIAVSEYAEANNLTLEEAGRDLRYSRLAEFKTELDLRYVFLGHHGDDKVETVFFNLLRGCGLDGATAIQMQNGFYLRPLIDCTKMDITDYAISRGLDYREDHTNKENDFSRNQIRNLLLPQIEETLKRNVHKSLLRFSGICAEAADFIQASAHKLLDDSNFSRIGTDYVLLRRLPLADSHPCLAKEVLALVTEKLGCVYRWNYQSCEQIYQKILTGAVFCEYVRCLEISQWHDWIFICRTDKNWYWDMIISPEKKYQLDLFDLLLTAVENPENQLCFSVAAVKGNIRLTPLDPQAVFYPFGSERPVAVNKLLSDKKIPRFLRKKLFMLSDDEKVLYIALAGIDNRCRFKTNAEPVMRIELKDLLSKF